MPSNIELFRSTLFDREGPAKLDRFRLRFPVPPSVTTLRDNNGNSISNVLRQMEFFCNSVDLPGMGLATRNITRYGYGAHEKKPVFPLFNDLWMQFINDGGNVNLIFFQQWLTSINNAQFFGSINGSRIDIGTRSSGDQPMDVYELSYKEDYAVDAQITLFDAYDKPRYIIAMRDFFPVMIPEIKMAWDNVNQIFQMVVMFAYTDWYLLRPGESDEPTVQTPVQTLG